MSKAARRGRPAASDLPLRQDERTHLRNAGADRRRKRFEPKTTSLSRGRSTILYRPLLKQAGPRRRLDMARAAAKTVAQAVAAITRCSTQSEAEFASPCAAETAAPE